MNISGALQISLRFLYILALVFMISGCEIDNRSPGGGTESGGTYEDSPASQVEDDVEWSGIIWLTERAPAARTAVKVMNLSASISSDGRQVMFSFEKFPWSSNANAHFFVWNGTAWRGGKFEGLLYPGQKVKELKNIKSGYNGHTPPAKGTPVAFAWTTTDGKERSNLAKTIWR